MKKINRACVFANFDQDNKVNWSLEIYAVSVDQIVYTPKPLMQCRRHANLNMRVDINEKISPFQRAYPNTKNKCNGIDTPQVIAFKKHRENSPSIKGSNGIDKCTSILTDATMYINNYLDHKLHTLTYLIGLKYHRTLYTHCNYSYLKNILMDIIR